jgi:hypothetical protein
MRGRRAGSREGLQLVAYIGVLMLLAALVIRESHRYRFRATGTALGGVALAALRGNRYLFCAISW